MELEWSRQYPERSGIGSYEEVHALTRNIFQSCFNFFSSGDSNLRQDTEYPDWGFSSFSSVHLDTFQDRVLNQATTLPFNIPSSSSFTAIRSFNVMSQQAILSFTLRLILQSGLNPVYFPTTFSYISLMHATNPTHLILCQ
jgi:hypothetical protein